MPDDTLSDPLTDPRCLVTVESLLVDGANGVCRDARLGARGPGRAAGLLLGAALVAAWLLAPVRVSARARLFVLAIVALLASVPGWAAMAAERADRPDALAATAGTIARFHDAVRTFAVRHGCARVTIERCVACTPVVRLALAGLRCERPAPIELGADAMRGCAERNGTLVCGSVSP